jgi:choice-of-anchor A domain-containing protein
MRLSAAAVALVIGGATLAAAGAPAATAAPAPATCDTNPLGVAGKYTEFVEGDAYRSSDSEGAVAYGGNAFLGNGPRLEGFSVGAKVKDAGSLPGGHTLITGKTLTAVNVTLGGGSGVYADLKPMVAGTPAIHVGEKHAKGASPVDFAKEFDTLRARSAYWASLDQNGKSGKITTRAPEAIVFEGTDKKLNVFNVSGAELQKYREIDIDVPGGSSTIINVTGASYDMSANGTWGVQLKDPATGKFVTDDYAAGSDAFKAVRSNLLWNFPTATAVTKNYASWPGTIFAPNAAVQLGDDKTGGLGHVNGSVVAKSIKSGSGAETHFMTFKGCLPTGTNTPGTPLVPAKPVVPVPTTTPITPLKPPVTPSAKPSAPATPTTPATVPTPSATPTGPELAKTGAEGGGNTGLLAGAGAVLLLGVGASAFAMKRRRTI